LHELREEMAKVGGVAEFGRGIGWAGEPQGIIGFAMALAFRKPGNYRGTVIEIDGF
jgi:hypothetical protein